MHPHKNLALFNYSNYIQKLEN